jgi:hypothetical protein
VVGKYNFLLPGLGEGVICQLRDPDAADDELPGWATGWRGGVRR